MSTGKPKTLFRFTIKYKFSFKNKYLPNSVSLRDISTFIQAPNQTDQSSENHMLAIL